LIETNPEIVRHSRRNLPSQANRRAVFIDPVRGELENVLIPLSASLKGRMAQKDELLKGNAININHCALDSNSIPDDVAAPF
jgi:hypothetical protein